MFSFIKKLINIIMITILLIIAYYGYSGYKMYKEAISKISLNDKVLEIKSNENYTKLSDISTTYKDALISIEDHRFYEHHGIDLISIARAIFINIQDKEFEQGGSTITQQLSKNLYFSQSKRIERKFAELFVTYDLEKNYSKDEILELYINTMYFGNGYYGIKQATEGYFHKQPSELDKYEATLLAGITNAPSIYSSEKNKDLATQRQKLVLNAMVKYNKINQDEADKILE